MPAGPSPARELFEKLADDFRFDRLVVDHILDLKLESLRVRAGEGPHSLTELPTCFSVVETFKAWCHFIPWDGFRFPIIADLLQADTFSRLPAGPRLMGARMSIGTQTGAVASAKAAPSLVTRVLSAPGADCPKGKSVVCTDTVSTSNLNSNPRSEVSNVGTVLQVQILETPPKEPHPKRQVDDVLPVATPVRSSLQAKAKLSEPDTVVTTPVMKHRFSTPGRPLAPSQTSFSRMFFSPAPVVKQPEPERKAPAPVAAAGTAASVPAPVPASVMATKDEKMAKSPESQPATDGSVGETTPVTPVSLHKISAAIFGNRGAVECFRGRVRYRRGPTAKAEATAKAKAKNTKEQVGRPRGKRRNLAVKVVGRKAMAKAKAKSASKAAVMRGKAMKAVSARRRRARPVPEVSREDPMEVVKDQADPADLADPADQAGGRPMRMILAGKDALKTASRKAPEIPPPRIRSAAAAADEGKESEDELPLSRLIEQKAPVSKVPAPTSWSEQLSYPLESAKFPIRIYPMGQAPQDEDDPWSSCSEPEDDDLLDAGKGCVTELVWCRESF
ncbi:unnamed protein product [Cladocopium goreaui]|uniref:Uncharacterized protein n=1 Tax=Cladocopium goreaui TaxID=2562237 RepID=A0A9P1CVR8_9DINO|nr:unnamed protein product [Cladocopium goreaui]